MTRDEEIAMDSFLKALGSVERKMGKHIHRLGRYHRHAQERKGVRASFGYRARPPAGVDALGHSVTLYVCDIPSLRGGGNPVAFFDAVKREPEWDAFKRAAQDKGVVPQLLMTREKRYRFCEHSLDTAEWDEAAVHVRLARPAPDVNIYLKANMRQVVPLLVTLK